MKQTFNKRTFDMPLLVKSAAMAVVSAPRIVMALRKPTTSRALQEQVMLAVTSVNDCRYCDWVHTGLALEEGVNIEELAGLLNHDAPQPLDRMPLGHLIAHNRAHCGIVALHPVPLCLVGIEQHLPTDNFARGFGNQAHDRERGYGLAATGFADDAKSLPLADGERDIINSVDNTGTGMELGLEVQDIQNSLGKFAL